MFNSQFPSSLIYGKCDGISKSFISGWAVDAHNTSERLELELIAVTPSGTEVIACLVADQLREDLLKTNVGDGRYGFRYAVRRAMREEQIYVRVAKSKMMLPGTPIRLDCELLYDGQVERLEGTTLIGWGWRGNGQPTNIEIREGDRFIAMVPAHHLRSDLAMLGIGDGRHSFAVDLADLLADGQPHELTCKFAMTDIELDNSPFRIPARMAGGYAISSDGLRVKGWAAWGNAAEPRRLAIEVDGRRVRTLVADGHKPDLASIGGTGGGCGFIGLLPPGTPRDRVGVRDLESGVLLPAFRPDAAPASATPENPIVPPTGMPEKEGPRWTRFLVAVWGENYIRLFCSYCLPTLLSPNNIPALAGRRKFEFVVLTRSTDRQYFEEFPAFEMVKSLTTVLFIDIDDILSASFDRNPHAYGVPLTRAYFRGIRELGEQMKQVDFIFWNADFIASDGSLRRLADLIDAGVRCTLAPSLRIVREDAEQFFDIALRDSPASIAADPRALVRLAIEHMHPTVMAKMVNGHSHLHITTANQFYWTYGPNLLVGRFFLLFMLHFRPEVLVDDIHGFCDYAFVPEFVPSGRVHYETDSDDMFIGELQYRDKEVDDIIGAGQPVRPEDVAERIGYWATREQRLAAEQVLLFKAAAVQPDLAAIRAETDRFMRPLFRLLPEEPRWHYNHPYWVGSCESIGERHVGPPVHLPASYLSKDWAWTGFDLDVYRDSFADQPHLAFRQILAAPPPADAKDPAAAWQWLRRLDDAYRAAFAATVTTPATEGHIDLGGPFHGFGWGFRQEYGTVAVRRLGPHRRGTILLRVQLGRSYRLRIAGVRQPDGVMSALGIRVNGEAVLDPSILCHGDRCILNALVDQDVVGRSNGILAIELLDHGGGDALSVHTCGFAPVRSAAETALDGLGRDRRLYTAPACRLSDVYRQMLAIGVADWNDHPAVRRWVRMLDQEFERSFRRLDWPAADRLRIDLAGDVPGFGWGGIVPAGGALGRRIGNDRQAVLFLPLDRRSDRDLVVDLHAAAAPADVLSLTLSVDGEPLPDSTILREDGMLRLRGHLPRLAGDGPAAPAALRIACGPDSENGEERREAPAVVLLGVHVVPPGHKPSPDIAAFSFASVRAAASPDSPAGDVPAPPEVEDALEALSQSVGSDLALYLSAADAIGGAGKDTILLGIGGLAETAHLRAQWLEILDEACAAGAASLPAVPPAGTALTGPVVPGFGWGMFVYENGGWGRHLGGHGSAFIILDLAAPGHHELRLRCRCTEDTDLRGVTASIGGEPLESLPTLRGRGDAVLRWLVPARLAQGGHVLAELRDGPPMPGASRSLFTDVAVLPVPADAPTPVPAQEPPADTAWVRPVMELLGREGLPYIQALHALGEPFAMVFRMLRRTRSDNQTLIAHWVHLLDRAIVGHWWDSAPEPRDSIDIDFLGSFAGFGWGPGAVRRQRHGRHLGGDGMATLLMRLQVGPSYRLSINIAETGGAETDGAQSGPPLRPTANGVPLEPLGTGKGNAWLLPAHLVRTWDGMMAIGLAARNGAALLVHQVACHPLPGTGDGPPPADPAMPTAPNDRRGLFLHAALGQDVCNVDYLNWLGALPSDTIAMRRRQIDATMYQRAKTALGQEYADILAQCPPEAAHNDSFCANWHNQVNAAYARAVASGGVALPSEGTIHFASHFHGLNWGDCTYEQGVAGRRLSGMKEATVFLRLDHGRDHRLTLHLHPAHVAAGLRLAVAVNRRPVEVRCETTGTDTRLSWTLGRLDLAALGGLVAITITLDREIGEWYGAFCGGIPSAVLERNPAPALSKLVVQAQEPVRRPAAPRVAERPNAVHIAVPVWGRSYLDLYESTALPSVLGRDNLPAIRAMGLVVHVMTDGNGRETLLRSPRFQALREIAREVVFHALDEVRGQAGGQSLLTSNYDAMTRFHRLVLAQAAGSGGAAVFLNADTVYAANAFARIGEVAAKGLRTVEALTLRTNRDSIVPALARLAGPKDVIDIAPRDLMQLAFHNLHPITMARFWDGPPGLIVPDNLYWIAGVGAILARCTHYMPVYVFPRLSSISFSGTIDHDLVANIGVESAERWLVPDSDQFAGIEVSPPGHSQNFAPYERGSVTSMVRFFELCQPIHEHNLQHRCRIHNGQLPDHDWQRTEEASTAVVRRVLAAVKEAQMNPGMPAWAA